MDLSLGLILGITFAATPGPVNVETLRQSLKGGVIDGLAVQAGSSLGRILYGLLALFGAGLLFEGATLQLAIGGFGVTVLFYLGITAIRSGRKLVEEAGEGTAGETSPRRAFWTGAALSLANPLAAVFWLSVGSRVLHDPGLDGPAFLGGFYLGCIVTSLAVAILAGWGRARLTAKAVRAVSWTCGLVLIAFGLKLGLSVGSAFIAW
jgi:threonine/homoserine/homoserine lactone efflux protein